MSDYVPRLVQLPGTETSPQLVLHRTLDKLAHIKAITVVIQWNNNEYTTDWSQMRVSELCMATAHLQEQCRLTMFEGENK